jgi:hypothetical protein
MLLSIHWLLYCSAFEPVTPRKHLERPDWLTPYVLATKLILGFSPGSAERNAASASSIEAILADISRFEIFAIFRVL